MTNKFLLKNITISGIVDLFFYLSIFAYFFINTLMYSTLNLPALSTIFKFFIVLIPTFCFLRLIVYFYKYSNVDFIISIVLIIYALFLFFNSESYVWVFIFLFLCSCIKTINKKKLLLSIFLGILLSYLIVVLMALLGQIPNLSFIRNDGTYRPAIGFNHPNNFGMFSFEICLLLFFLYFKNHKFIVILSQAFIFYANYFIVFSRTSAFLILLTFLFEIVLILFGEKRYYKLKKPFIFLICILFLVIIIYLLISYEVFPLNYTIDNFFSSRLSLSINYANSYSIKFFGQNLIYGKESNAFLYTLDNSYLYLLLGFGFIPFVFYFLSLLISFYMCFKKNLYREIIVLIMFCFYGFTETCLLRFDLNFSIIFIGFLTSDFLNSKIGIFSETSKILLKFK